jgi:ubiquinone/menaquinone biosynthesis C-methylase UbiE
MTAITTSDDTALKAKHRAMWASGNYPELASDLIWSLGPVLVEAAGIGPGHRVLDIAAGSGNVAIPAARTGAAVVASDLAPELFDAGRRLARDADVEIDWQEADAEHLPYADGSFDAALSCVGIMFAPHHELSADELVRVTRPGGTIGLISWTPSGFIGQLFATMKPFAAPPAPGARPAPLWGDPAHVLGLLGDRVTDVSVSTRTVTITHFGQPSDFREYFRSHYGPAIAVYARVADDPSQVAQLDAAIDALAASAQRADGAMDWEYLLLTARRAG